MAQTTAEKRERTPDCHYSGLVQEAKMFAEIPREPYMKRGVRIKNKATANMQAHLS